MEGRGGENPPLLHANRKDDAAMARDKTAAHVEDPRVPEAETEDEFLAHLLSLRQSLDEYDGPDIIKANLQRIAGGLDSLADALRTVKNQGRTYA